MKVLIISAEVWREDTNGGNVLSNLFAGSDLEFAQIFCNPGAPQNSICKKYYQMTDSMMIKSIFRKGKPGKTLNYQNYPKHEKTHIAEQENKKLYSFLRIFRFEIFYVIRSIIWKIAKWDNDDLKNFIIDFKPDLIFAPCYASHELLAIDRFAKKVINVPMVSYISDDNYGLLQFRLDPVYWINRFVLRKNIRKTFKIYDLIYTMTDEQKQEYEKALHCNMKILKKGGNFIDTPIKQTVNCPIRLIYAGGINYGRWKTLGKIVEEIRKINKQSFRLVLDIYTGNQLTQKQKKILDDGINSHVHASISLEQLQYEYHSSDIALHVESFDLKYKLLTRLSFSTKIIDCLGSGCAVMAICWNEHAGYKYLQRNKIAICVDNLHELRDILLQCVEKKEMIVTYAKAAREFGLKNHQIEKIRDEFIHDLEIISKSHCFEYNLGLKEGKA